MLFFFSAAVMPPDLGGMEVIDTYLLTSAVHEI